GGWVTATIGTPSPTRILPGAGSRLQGRRRSRAPCAVGRQARRSSLRRRAERRRRHTREAEPGRAELGREVGLAAERRDGDFDTGGALTYCCRSRSEEHTSELQSRSD